MTSELLKQSLRRPLVEVEFTPLEESCVAIVGLGLMGGSLALALKDFRVCRQVVALVRRDETIRESLDNNIVDVATKDATVALAEADIVVFSTPVRVLLHQLTELAPFYKAGAIITDMGSTKQEIMQVMNSLPETVYPIGSHPMCGKEQAGLVYAETHLFENAPWILTPLPRTPPSVVDMMTKLATAIRAKPQQIEMTRHDRLVAAISHVPYTISTALVLAVQTLADRDPKVWEVAASGFRDTSRLAASDVTMMLDILLTNRAAVLEVLGELDSQLSNLREAVAALDEATLRVYMEKAAQQRRSMYQ